MGILFQLSSPSKSKQNVGWHLLILTPFPLTPPFSQLPILGYVFSQLPILGYVSPHHNLLLLIQNMYINTSAPLWINRVRLTHKLLTFHLRLLSSCCSLFWTCHHHIYLLTLA